MGSIGSTYSKGYKMVFLSHGSGLFLLTLVDYDNFKFSACYYLVKFRLEEILAYLQTSLYL